MRGDSDLHMGKVMDLAQTCTSMANDVAGDSVWNSKSHSDAGLIHGGDGVDCLLGVTCRHWHSARVPATMRRVGLRISQGTRGWCSPWGSGRSLPHKKGDKCRVVMNGLTEILTDHNKLLMRERGPALSWYNLPSFLSHLFPPLSVPHPISVTFQLHLTLSTCLPLASACLLLPLLQLQGVLMQPCYICAWTSLRLTSDLLRPDPHAKGYHLYTSYNLSDPFFIINNR